MNPDLLASPTASTDQQSDGATVALARWSASLQYEDIPPDIVAHIKTCLLDAIGCGLYGSGQPWGTIVADTAIAWSGDGKSSLFGRPEKVSPPDAALANGTAIHGFEIDDIHVASSYHPASVTIPTALVIAESHASSGRDLLVGIVAGYEAGIRLGMAAGVSHSTSGYHVTGTVGSVGSAAAASRMLGLDADQTAHAIGIGATQAAGLYSARKGAMAKRFHGGRAAQSGVVAAYLASRGFTGSQVAIEAPFGGFLSTMNGQSGAETMLSGLGDHWETGRVGFKIYAACASAHTIVDALDELIRQGLTTANLQHLTIHMSRKGALNVGWTYAPGEVISAQMNGYYTAAVKLLDGEAFVDQFSPDRIADPRIMTLIERMTIVHDPALDLGGAAKRHAVRVEARRTDGVVLKTYVEQRRGSAEHPLSAAEIEAKFRYLAKKRLHPDAINEIIAEIETLEDKPDIIKLMESISQRKYQS